MKNTYTPEELSDLIILFERWDYPSPNFIRNLALKYSNYKFFELQDASCDFTWILAKDKKMAAELINQKEIECYGKGNNTVYKQKDISNI